MDGKLVILGLVKIEKSWAGLNGYDTDNIREKVELTLYGNKFSKFIFNEQ
ncbi:hypothetical protein LIT25_12425 [Bacillus sp. F19]|nr:hypothetical protein LIT25_12425 [Bacillus sp. F19]